MAYKTVGISHLHVSGEIIKNNNTTSNHCSLTEATNAKYILESLSLVKDICNGYLPPIILEGDYLSNVKYGIKTEDEIDIISSIAIQNMNYEIEFIKYELNIFENNTSRNLPVVYTSNNI